MSEVYQALVGPLADAGFEYLVTGGLAAAYYGKAFMMDDIDLVVRVDHEGAARLHQVFPDDTYEIPPVEEIRQLLGRSWASSFFITHRASGLKAHIHLPYEPLHDWAFTHRRAVAMGAATAWFAPVEYVLVRKMDARHPPDSDRHLEHVLWILREGKEPIDHAVMDRLVGERSMDTLWKLMLLNAKDPLLKTLIFDPS